MKCLTLLFDFLLKDTACLSEMDFLLLPNYVYRLLLTGHFMCVLKWVGLFSRWQLDFLWKKKCAVLVLWSTHSNLHVASWKYPDKIIMRCESVQAHCDKAVQTVCWPIWRGPNRIKDIKDTGLASIHADKTKTTMLALVKLKRTLLAFFTDLVFKDAVNW